MKIRRATREDAASLAALAERTFRHTFAADNTARDMDLHCAAAFGPEIQRHEIDDPQIVTLVVEHDEALVAYAQLRSAAPAQASAKVVADRPLELLRFYVEALHHGSGLAAALMEEAVIVAREIGADVLWLGVWEHNPRAIRFYGKLGFAMCGEQTFLLGADPQRDLVMALRLLPQ